MEPVADNSDRWTLLLLACIILVLVVDLYTIVRAVNQPDGSHDFHPYWYQGHFLRQGNNPYRAYLTGMQLHFPIEYLDGVVRAEPPIGEPGLSISIPCTAPLTLILFSFSVVSWPLAKWLWLLFNFLLMALLPFFVLRAFPRFQNFARNEQLLLALIVYTFGSIRASVEIGQSTLVVFTLMLGSLILRSNWLASGILLGFALSKYSLALPVVLFLILELRSRNILIIGTALLTQVAGLLPITLISGDSPVQIIANYADIFKQMADAHALAGVQLAILFPPESKLITPTLLLLTSVTVGIIAFWWSFRKRLTEEALLLANYHLLVAILLWTFLIVYHGGYDLLTTLTIVPLLLYAIRYPEVWQLSRIHVWLIIGVLVLFIGLFSVPYETLNSLTLRLPSLALMAQFERGYVITLLFLLIVTFWLLFHLSQNVSPVPRAISE